MSRISPIHYINPTAISIIPNANNSENDIAVNIYTGAKIKVYSPKSGIGTEGSSYQEWSISGRNRRLGDSTKPYTIYARLPKDSQDKGYLIFAPKVKRGDLWTDRYCYATPEGLFPQYDADRHPDGATTVDYLNWYIRLGDVSLPENGKRTLTLDTGILGTEQFNTEWALNPDALPLRIELGCTVDDEDAGPTPYVPWDKTLVLTAGLMEGWTGTDIERFDHWEITRNSGNASVDDEWNAIDRSAGFGQSGTIALSHIHGDGDDFSNAVSVVFTVTAWGHSVSSDSSDSSSSSASSELIPLLSESITVLAEALETFDMELSADTVSFNPMTNSYSPSNGVDVRIRAKSQNGNVFYPSAELIDVLNLHAHYQYVDDDSDSSSSDSSSSVSDLVLTDGIGHLPVSLFAAGKSINVWLEDGSNSILSKATVAYVRYGDKGDTPISVYKWNQSPSNAPYISGTEYPPSGWSINAPNRPSDGWFLWMSASYLHADGTVDAWATPVRISGDKGEAGEDSKNREYIFKTSASSQIPSRPPITVSLIDEGNIRGIVNTESEIPAGEYSEDDHFIVLDNQYGPNVLYTWHEGEWDDAGGTVHDGEYYWVESEQQYMTWYGSEWVKITISDIEAGVCSNNTVDGFVPDGWNDHPHGTLPNTPYEFMSYRDYNIQEGTWSQFGNPVIWSHWGRNGMDGDGVEYVYARTDKNVAPEIVPETEAGNNYRESVVGYDSDEHLPYVRVPKEDNDISGSTDVFEEGGYKYVKCTDDPVGTSPAFRYEWVLKRSKNAPNATGVRSWEPYSGHMAQWSYKPADITKQSETPYYAVTAATDDHPAAASSDWKTAKAAAITAYNTAHGISGSDLAQNCILWTKTDIEWSDGSHTLLYSGERNPNDGQPGQDIIVDGATVMKYYVGDSNTTHPADTSSEWKDLNQVTQTQGKWLWSQAKTNYKRADDGTPAGSSYNYSVNYIAKDGLPGKGIKSTTELYQATNSSAARQKPTSDTGWDTDPNLSNLITTDPANAWGESKKYLWNCEETVYSNPDSTESTEYTVPRIIAIWTKDGNAGKGIDSIVNYYKISDQATGITSGAVDGQSWTPPAGSGWDDDPIAPTEEQPYLWNFEKITWLDYGTGNQYTYTDAHVVGHFGTDGQDMRENIIDGSEGPMPFDGSVHPSNWATNSERAYYSTQMVYDTGKIPVDGTKMSGRAKVTLQDCVFTGNGTPNILLFTASLVDGSGRSWPSVAEFQPTGNGTYEVKTEGFVLNSDGSSGNTGVWNGKIDLRLDHFTSGTVIVEFVKWEVAHKCSAWCLSENDKKSKVLDIDNEYEKVETDSTGKITTARTVETVVHLWRGSEEIDISNSNVTISGGPATSGEGKIADFLQSSEGSGGKGRKLTWSFIAGKTMTSVYEISVRYTYFGKLHKATFTVAASLGLPIYQLKTSLSAVPFSRNAAGELIEQSKDVGLSIVKIDGGSTTEYTSASDAGVIVRYSFESMPSSKTDGTGWASGNISVANTVSNLYIAMFNSGGSLYDRETVPVVKDGAKGTDGQNAVRIDIDNQEDFVSCDNEGKVRFARDVTTNVRLFDGASTVKSGLSISAQSIRISPVTNGNLSYVEPTVSSIDSTTGIISITWAFATNMVLTQDVYPVDIQLTYNDVPHTAKFKLKRTDSTAIYQVTTSSNELSFSRNSDGTLTPATRDVTCAYSKSDADGTTPYEWPSTSNPKGSFLVKGVRYHLLWRRIGTDGNPIPTFSGAQAYGWDRTYDNGEGGNNRVDDYTTRIPGGVRVSSDCPYLAYEFAISKKVASESNDTTDIIDRETVPLIKDGAKGSAGDNGYSTAVVRLYRRYAPTEQNPLPELPTGTLTYTFATGRLSGSSASFNDWNQSMPAEDPDTKLYVTMATARSREATDTIAANEWSTPVEYADGLHSATVMLYKRSATALSAHGITAAVYYRFSDGKLFTTKTAVTETAIDGNKLSGWTRTMPATDGTPCYQIQATAVGTEDLDKIGSGEWSSPVKMVEDGHSINKTDETYRYAVSASGSTHPTASGNASDNPAQLDKWYDDRSKVAAIWDKNKYLWTETMITWSDGSHTLLYSGERNPNDGQPGQDVVAGETVITYCVKDVNYPQPPDSDFGAYDPSKVVPGKWLWMKATTPYYKGSTSGASAGSSTNYSISYIGTNGANGRALTGVSEHYNISNSSSTSWNVPSSGTWDDDEWTTDPNVPNGQGASQWGENARYLWNYEKVTYQESNGATTIARTTPSVVAIWTKDGNAGKGIDSIVNYYKISDQATGITSGAVDGQSWTPPAGSGWDDDPIAPTEEQPYLWNFEKITWLDYGTGNQYTYTDAHVVGHFGKDGTSPVIADMSNEMFSVATDSNGYVTNGPDTREEDGESDVTDCWHLQSIIKLFHGSTQLTINNNSLVVTGGNDIDAGWDGVYDNPSLNKGIFPRISSDGKNGIVDIWILGECLLQETVTLNVSASSTINGSVVTKNKDVIINVIRAGADGATPIVYDLMPSANAINVQRTAAGGYTPQLNTLTCGYKKIEGSTVNIVEEVTTTKVSHKYVLLFRRRNRSTQQWESRFYHYNGTTEGIPNRQMLVVTSGVSGSGLDVSAYDKVEFVFYTETGSVPSYYDSLVNSKIIDRETVPVVSDGTKGESTIHQRIYCSNNSGTTPDTPAGDSPSGWSTVPTGVNTVSRYRWMSERVSYDSGATWGSGWSAPQIDTYLAEDGTSISIKGQAVGVVSYGSNTPSPLIYSVGDILLMNSAVAYDIITKENSNAWSSGTANIGDGYITDNGHLWMKVNATSTSATSLRWKDVGNIRGPKGDDGVNYELVPSPDAINFRSNAVGEFSGSVTLSCAVWKTEGSNAAVSINSGTDDLYLYYRLVGSGWTGSWYVYAPINVTAANAIEDAVTSVEYALSTQASASSVNDNNTIRRKRVPIIFDGRRGAQGATGKIFYPMGVYENKEYTRTGDIIPLVFLDSNEWNSAIGAYGNYWYLKADTNNMGTAQSPEYEAPSDSSICWEEADSFGLVITQGIFSQFAKFGGFIVSGDYFYSQFGTLVPVSGDEIPVDATNASTLYPVTTGRLPYSWFDSSDPMAATRPSTGYKFRPNKCIDAYTGEEWMASGNVHVSRNGDVSIQGATMIDKVDVLKGRAYTVGAWGEKATGKLIEYYFADITNGSLIVFSEDDKYYNIGSIRMKCNRLFVYTEGIENYPSSYDREGESILRIVLPPAYLFVGQSIVITNRAYGFSNGKITLEQEYLRLQSNDYSVCLTESMFIKNENNGINYSNYAYKSQMNAGANPTDCAPYDAPQTADGELILLSGIWQLIEGKDQYNLDYKYPIVTEKIDLTDYEWIELTAVNGDYIIDDTNTNPPDAKPYNVVWMITRFEKKVSE